MKPYWVAYVFGGSYDGGWRPSLWRHVRKYYREEWRRAGYTLTDWVLGREKAYFRRKRVVEPPSDDAVGQTTENPT